MRNEYRSPCIDNQNRLADVIAAIQAMGVYKFHMRTFEEWAEGISGDSTSIRERWNFNGRGGGGFHLCRVQWVA